MGIYRKLKRQAKGASKIFMAGRFISALAAATVLTLPSLADAQNITKADSAHENTIHVNGNVTEIFADEYAKNDAAINHFSNFQLDSGNIANMRFGTEGGADAGTLINLVDSRADINGIVNAVRNGTIDGNLYFISSKGIAVGADGVINAGKIGLINPTDDYYQELLRNKGDLSDASFSVDKIRNGEIPLNTSGTITVEGKLNATSGINLAAAEVNIKNGAQLQSVRTIDYSDLVNVSAEVSAGLDAEKLKVTKNDAGEVVITVAIDSKNLGMENNFLDITGFNYMRMVDPETAAVNIENGASVKSDGKVDIQALANSNIDINLGENSAVGTFLSMQANVNVDGEVTGDTVNISAKTNDVYKFNSTVTGDDTTALDINEEQKTSTAEMLKQALTQMQSFLNVPSLLHKLHVSTAFAGHNNSAAVRIGDGAVVTATGDDTDNPALKISAAGIFNADLQAKNTIRGTLPALGFTFSYSTNKSGVDIDGDIEAQKGSIAVTSNADTSMTQDSLIDATKRTGGAATLVTNLLMNDQGSAVNLGENSKLNAAKNISVTSTSNSPTNVIAEVQNDSGGLGALTVNFTSQTDDSLVLNNSLMTAGGNVDIKAEKTAPTYKILSNIATEKPDLLSQIQQYTGDVVKNIIDGAVKRADEKNSNDNSSATKNTKAYLTTNANVAIETSNANVIVGKDSAIKAGGDVNVNSKVTFGDPEVGSLNVTSSDFVGADSTFSASPAVNYVNSKNDSAVVFKGDTEITGDNVTIKSEFESNNVRFAKARQDILDSADEIKNIFSAENLSDKQEVVGNFFESLTDLSAADIAAFVVQGADISQALNDLRGKLDEKTQFLEDYQQKINSTADKYQAEKLMQEVGLKYPNVDLNELKDELFNNIEDLISGGDASQVTAKIDALKDSFSAEINTIKTAVQRVDTICDTAKVANYYADKEQVTGKKSSTANTGFALAGTVNIDFLDNSTRLVLGKNTAIDAENNVDINTDLKNIDMAVSGHIKPQTSAASALLFVVNSYTAHDDNVLSIAENTLINGKNISVEGKNYSNHVLFSDGSGVAPEGRTRISGTVSYGGGESLALVSVDDEVNFNADENVTVNSENNSNLLNIAGGLAYTSGAGNVGASIAFNNFDVKTLGAFTDNDVDADSELVKLTHNKLSNKLNVAEIFGTAENNEIGLVAANKLKVTAHSDGAVNSLSVAGSLSTNGDSNSSSADTAEDSQDTLSEMSEMAQSFAHIIGYVANYFSLDDNAANSDNAAAENSSVLTKSIRKIDASQKSDKGSTTSTSGNAPVKNEKPSEVNTPKTNDVVDSKSLPSFTISGAGSGSINLAVNRTVSGIEIENVQVTDSVESKAVDDTFIGAWSGAGALNFRNYKASQNAKDSKNSATGVAIAGAAAVNIIDSAISSPFKNVYLDDELSDSTLQELQAKLSQITERQSQITARLSQISTRQYEIYERQNKLTSEFNSLSTQKISVQSQINSLRKQLSQNLQLGEESQQQINAQINQLLIDYQNFGVKQNNLNVEKQNLHEESKNLGNEKDNLIAQNSKLDTELKHIQTEINLNNNTNSAIINVSNDAIKSGAIIAAAPSLAIQHNSGANNTNFSGAASVGINIATNNVSAQLLNNTFDQVQSVTNTAQNNDTQIAGGINIASATGGSKGVALGGSVALSHLTNNIDAKIDGGSYNIRDSLKNNALNSVTQVVGSAGVSVASGESSSYGFQGVVAYNKVDNKDAATISNANITAANIQNVAADSKDAVKKFDGFLNSAGLDATGQSYADEVSVENADSSLNSAKKQTSTDGTVEDFDADKSKEKTKTTNYGNKIITGAFALAGSGNGSAMASIAISDVDNDFVSTVDGTITTNNVKVNAVSNTLDINAAAGAAVSSKGFGAGGSVSWQTTDNNVTAGLGGNNLSTLKDVKSVDIDAQSSALEVNVAGQISGGKGTALGLAMAYNALNDTTKTFIENINSSGNTDFNVNSTSQGSVYAVGAGVGVSTNSAALGGSIAINRGSNSTLSEINSAKIENAKNISVNAQDKVNKLAVVGNLQVSGGSAAVGGAVAYNDIGASTSDKQKTSVSISNSKVEGSSLDVGALDESELTTIGVGVGIAGKGAAVQGAVTVATINKDVDAKISNSTFNLSDVNITSESKEDITTFAGVLSVNAGTGAAVGAGVAINNDKTKTESALANSTVNSNGLKINSANNSGIVNVGIGGSGGGTGAAVTGSVAVNNIGTKTLTNVNDSNITSTNNVVVDSQSDELISNYAGSVSFTGTGAAVGVSVSVNNITSETASNVTGGSINVTDTDEEIELKNFVDRNAVGDSSFSEMIFGSSDSVGKATSDKDSDKQKAKENGAAVTQKVSGIFKAKTGLEQNRFGTIYRGIVVNSSATHSMQSLMINGGAAGTGAAVNGTVNINTIGGSTKAGVNGATLTTANSTEDVNILANDYTRSRGVVGSANAALTGAAVGLGNDSQDVSRTVDAKFIGKNFNDVDTNNFNVKAQNRQGMTSLIAGISLAGTGAGVSNGTGVYLMEGVTNATIDKADVKANSLELEGYHDAQINTLGIAAGFAAVGGGVGLGVDVLKETDKTTANLTNSNVNFKEYEDGTAYIASANSTGVNYEVYDFGVGVVGAGVAGAIGVSNVQNEVVTNVVNSNVGTNNSAMMITVDAFNSLNFGNTALAGAAGLGGIGAGVNVTTIDGKIQTNLDGSTLKAKDLTVNAYEDRTINQKSGSVAAGGGALSVNVMVTSVGKELESTYQSDANKGKEDDGSTVNVNETIGKANNGTKTNNDAVGRIGKDNSESPINSLGINAPQVSVTKGGAQNSGVSLNVTNSNLRGESISIQNQSNNNVTVTGVTASAGLAAVGGGVGILDVNRNANLNISGSKLDATKSLDVTLTDGGTSSLNVYQGAAGAIALNVSYANLNSKGVDNINIAQSELSAGDYINVRNADKSSAELNAIGVTGGGVAVGVLIAEGNVTNNNKVTIGNDSKISAEDGSVYISSTAGYSDNDLKVEAIAKSGGAAIAGAGIVASANGKSTAEVEVGDNATFDASVLNISAMNLTDIETKTSAQSTSMLASGSLSVVSNSAGTSSDPIKSKINIGNNVNLNADDIVIESYASPEQNLDMLSLSAAKGFGLGASGGILNTYTDNQINIGKVNYKSYGNVHINAITDPTQKASVAGLTIGTIASGTQILNTNRDFKSTMTLAGNNQFNDTYGTPSSVIIRSSTVSEPDFTVNGNGGGLVDVSPLAGVLNDNLKMNSNVTISGEWEADEFKVLNENVDGGNLKVTAAKASVLGASAVQLNRTENSSATINLESAKITTENVQDYQALNTLNLTETIEASGFGGANANGSSLGNTRQKDSSGKKLPSYKSAVNLDKAFLTTTDTNGEIYIDANTAGNITSNNTLNSTGAAQLTVANTFNDTEFNNAVNLNNSEITTQGTNADISIAASDNTNLKFANAANLVAGLGGIASSDAYNRLTRGNTVKIGTSKLDSGHDINLYTDATSDNVRGNLTLHVLSDAYNRTTIPLSTKPALSNSMTQNNLVDIGTNSNLRSMRNVNIQATTGQSELVESSREYNIYTGTSGNGRIVSTALGDTSIPGETRNNRVNIDGAISAGKNNELDILIENVGDNSDPQNIKAKITVSKGDNVISPDSIKSDAVVTIVNPYLEEYNKTVSSMLAYPAGTEENKSLKAYADSIAELMVSYGFAEKKSSGVYNIFENIQMQVIDIPDFALSGGDINIYTSTLEGNGALTARSALGGKIKNETPSPMRINNVSMENAGGYATFNGNILTKSAGYNFSKLDTDGNADNRPALEITQTGKKISSITPDVLIEGTINNSTGKVTVNNSNGSVIVRGNVNAGGGFEVIAPNGGFMLSDSKATYSLTDPLTMFTFGNQDVADTFQKYLLESGVNSRSVWDFTDYDDYLDRIFRRLSNATKMATGGSTDFNTWKAKIKKDYGPQSDGDEPRGSIVTSGPITIIAKDINVNGLIQSGFLNYNGTVDASKISEIHEKVQAASSTVAVKAKLLQTNFTKIKSNLQYISERYPYYIADTVKPYVERMISAEDHASLVKILQEFKNTSDYTDYVNSVNSMKSMIYKNSGDNAYIELLTLCTDFVRDYQQVKSQQTLSGNLKDSQVVGNENFLVNSNPNTELESTVKSDYQKVLDNVGYINKNSPRYIAATVKPYVNRILAAKDPGSLVKILQEFKNTSDYTDYVNAVNSMKSQRTKSTSDEKYIDTLTYATELVQTYNKLQTLSNKTWNSSTKMYDGVVNIYYNPTTKNFLTEDLNVGNGGIVMLKGNILSTGNGRIVAAKGAANIKIDTSNAEGDLNLGAINNTNRLGNVIIEDTSTNNGRQTFDRNSSYTPTKGKAYAWTGGIDYTTTLSKTLVTEAQIWGAWDLDNDTKFMTYVRNNPDKVSARMTSTTDGKLMDNGVFVTVNNDLANRLNQRPNLPVYTVTDIKNTTSASPSPRVITTNYSGFLWAHKTTTARWTEKQGRTATSTYYIPANKTISIETPSLSDSDVSVNVKSAGSIYVTNGITNQASGSSVTLNSSDGEILTLRNFPIIATNVSMTADKGINANVRAVYDIMKLNAETNNGNIGITSGSTLKLGTIEIKNTDKKDNPYVIINATGSIDDGTINAPRIILNSDNESINNVTTNLVNGVETSLPLERSISAVAQRDITLTSNKGDMRINQIESKEGDVSLTSKDGDIIDVTGQTYELSDSFDRLQRWLDTGLVNKDDAEDSSEKSAAVQKSYVLEGLVERAKVLSNNSEERMQIYQDLAAKLAASQKMQNAKNIYAYALKTSPEITKKSTLDIDTAEENYLLNVNNPLADKLTTTAQDEYFAKVKEFFKDTDLSDDELKLVSDYAWTNTSDAYGFSKNQLLYAIQDGILNSKPGQTVKIETPNIKGNSITLSSAGGIGNDDSTVTTIPLTELTKTENLKLFSTLKAGDVTWGINDVTVRRQQPVSLEIKSNDKGNLSVDAKKQIYLAGTDNTAFNFGKFDHDTNSNVRLMTGNGIFTNDETTIGAKDLIVYGGKGNVGTTKNPLRVNLEGSLDANSGDSVYISSVGDNKLTIQAVAATNNVNLHSKKDMIMTTENGKTGGYISGKNISLSVDISTEPDANTLSMIRKLEDAVSYLFSRIQYYTSRLENSSLFMKRIIHSDISDSKARLKDYVDRLETLYNSGNSTGGLGLPLNGIRINSETATSSNAPRVTINAGGAAIHNLGTGVLYFDDVKADWGFGVHTPYDAFFKDSSLQNNSDLLFNTYRRGWQMPKLNFSQKYSADELNKIRQQMAL